VGQQNELVRAEDRGRLGHEVDAAEDDDLGLGGGGLDAEFERVARQVGDVLDGRYLVVVGEDDGLLLRGQPPDVLFEPGFIHLSPFAAARSRGPSPAA
jgi:hypothetical protein